MTNINITQKSIKAFNQCAKINNWPNTDEQFLNEINNFEKSYFLKYIKKNLNIFKDTKVLEIGGGRGLIANILNKYSDFVHLINLNEDEICGLKAAKKISYLTSRKLKTLKANFENMPYNSNYFDIILAKSCLHHSLNIMAAFKEISRVIKKDGYFMMIEPCRGEFISEKFTYRNYYKLPGMSKDMNEHSPKLSSWLACLQENNFKIIKIKPTYFLSLKDFILRRKILKYLIPILNPLLKLSDICYLPYAKYLGHPILLPHNLTFKMAGFEYYEVIIVAKKVNNL